jgi:hypothetical protein
MSEERAGDAIVIGAALGAGLWILVAALAGWL